MANLPARGAEPHIGEPGVRLRSLDMCSYIQCIANNLRTPANISETLRNPQNDSETPNSPGGSARSCTEELVMPGNIMDMSGTCMCTCRAFETA